MVIRNYHWLNSASRVLISTCSAPLVQTGERKQFSLFDLDVWPTTLTYNPRLAKVKVDPHAKNQGQRSNGSNRRSPTVKRTYTHTDATKRIISSATRSINIAVGYRLVYTCVTLKSDNSKLYLHRYYSTSRETSNLIHFYWPTLRWPCDYFLLLHTRVNNGLHLPVTLS